MSTRPARRRDAASDHRTRVGRERRARTRAAILEAAFRVFAQKGPDAPVIDDFIRAAGVARGTFYNHFRTTDELFVATSQWLEDNFMRAIDADLAAIEDPVARLASGVRLWLARSREEPALCGFIVRNRHRGRLVERILGGDLRGGARAGRLGVERRDTARDLVVGAIREAMGRMMDGPVSRGYVDELARAILRGLGIDEGEIDRLCALPLPGIAHRARARER
jgi:AcrR family transcriptional regulator